MAQVLSLVMIIFTVVPALAPLIGDQIIKSFGWRGVFPAFSAFGFVLLIWYNKRLGETLIKKKGIVFVFSKIWPSLVLMYRNKQVRYAICIQTFCYGILFSSLVLIQPIFDVIFQRGTTFPLWFALIAIIGATASILNAKLVIIHGMRSMVLYPLITQVVFSGLVIIYFVILPQTGNIAFSLYFGRQTMIFFQAGLTLGNLNALALEPMGQIAGFAASVAGGIATVFGSVLSMGVNISFNGTPLPLMVYTFLMALVGLLFTIAIKRE